MIIKGSARGQSSADATALARHLLAAENASVAVLELRGVAAIRLPEALAEMRALSLGTRTRRALYHASINPDRDEAPGLTDRQWFEAADELERRLGMTGHQRAVVRHVKNGRAHVHVVWGRVNPVTFRVAHDGQNYRRHEECARALERRWRLRPVMGVHTRPRGTRRPVVRATHGDWQAQERTGIRVEDVARLLRRCWDEAADGAAFRAAVWAAGLSLASGRRGIVVIDAAGTPHSLPRRLGLRAGIVWQRLADLDPAALPTADDCVATSQWHNDMSDMAAHTF